MKLLKVKGVVIKEIPYKENDKIITLMTDSLGKISCMARGAKKTNSALLASCQLLVYSEFVLYKGTSFYHINSAEIIDTFYNLRIDLDKLERAYEITKSLNNLVYENQETEGVLSLYLNTLFVIANKEMSFNYVQSVFRLKLLALLGYSPSIVKCVNCNTHMVEKEQDNNYYYSYNMNNVLCGECYNKLMKENMETIKNGWYVRLSKAAFYAMYYILASDIKKIFSFKIDDKTEQELTKLVDRLYVEQISF